MAENPKLPLISITKESSEELSDEDCNNGDDPVGNITDIEDFASDIEGDFTKSLKKHLTKSLKKTSPNITDIEDYNDSESEEEKSEAIPEVELSLKEFLDLGYSEETIQVSDGVNKQNKTFPFLNIIEDDPGCVTDCENYETEDENYRDMGQKQHVNRISSTENGNDLSNFGENGASSCNCSGENSKNCKNYLNKDRCDRDANRENNPLPKINLTFVVTEISEKQIEENCAEFEEDLKIKQSSSRSSKLSTENTLLSVLQNTLDQDKGHTDIEDISANEEDLYEEKNKTIPEKYTIIENAIVTNSESVKNPSNRKSFEFSAESEPKTDIEEFFVAGTVSRKKTKCKMRSKSKPNPTVALPDTVKYNVTDVEEFEDSDKEKLEFIKNYSIPNDENVDKKITHENMTSYEKVAIQVDSDNEFNFSTDIEEMSGEEISIEEGKEKQSSTADINNLTEDLLYSTISSVDTLTQDCMSKTNRKPSPIPYALTKDFQQENCSFLSNQTLTDVEDIGLLSDIDDGVTDIENANSVVRNYNNLNSCASPLPNKYHSLLNEYTGGSTVHEKCVNVFNMDTEKHHIKGMKYYPEIQTDVESFDEEEGAIALKSMGLTHGKNMTKGEEVEVEKKPPEDQKK